MSGSSYSAHRRTPLTAAVRKRVQRTVGEPRPVVDEVSAGGMVVRRRFGRYEVAIIARYNRGGRLEWVLPKGHPEGDEKHHEAAVREIQEETGIQGTVVAQLGSIEYSFGVGSYRVHKTVYHYLLAATGGTLSIENDPDHEAVDVAWVDIGLLPSRLTFLNERRIVDAARPRLHQLFTTENQPPGPPKPGPEQRPQSPKSQNFPKPGPHLGGHFR